jgi:hypothetical protein
MKHVKLQHGQLSDRWCPWAGPETACGGRVETFGWQHPYLKSLLVSDVSKQQQAHHFEWHLTMCNYGVCTHGTQLQTPMCACMQSLLGGWLEMSHCCVRLCYCHCVQLITLRLTRSHSKTLTPIICGDPPYTPTPCLDTKHSTQDTKERQQQCPTAGLQEHYSRDEQLRQNRRCARCLLPICDHCQCSTRASSLPQARPRSSPLPWARYF